MKRLEERCLNAWPSLQTVVYDGWLLRFADGYTKRANSISPIYESSVPLEEKMAYCEAIYSEKQIRTVYKITPFSHPEHLDQILEAKGYFIQDETILQTALLAQIPEPSYPYIKQDDDVTRDWISHYSRFSQATVNDQETMYRMFQLIQPSRCFMQLLFEGEVVAVGFAVSEQGYVGIFDILTNPAYRKKGFGEQLVLHLLNWAKKHGATYGYLQVVANNEPAKRLYAKLGFEEAYRYWYRVKALSE